MLGELPKHKSGAEYGSLEPESRAGKHIICAASFFDLPDLQRKKLLKFRVNLAVASGGNYDTRILLFGYILLRNKNWYLSRAEISLIIEITQWINISPKLVCLEPTPVSAHLRSSSAVGFLDKFPPASQLQRCDLSLPGDLAVGYRFERRTLRYRVRNPWVAIVIGALEAEPVSNRLRHGCLTR